MAHAKHLLAFLYGGMGAAATLGACGNFWFASETYPYVSLQFLLLGQTVDVFAFVSFVLHFSETKKRKTCFAGFFCIFYSTIFLALLKPENEMFWLVIATKIEMAVLSFLFLPLMAWSGAKRWCCGAKREEITDVESAVSAPELLAKNASITQI